MELKVVTIAIMVVTLVVWVVWDVYVAFVARDMDATFSRLLYAAARDTPAVALAFGVLMGHFFWPQALPKSDEESKENKGT